MLGKLKSDALGGFLGVSPTLKLGAEKRFGNRIFLSSLLSVFMIIFYCLQLYNAMGFSLIISLQHNNEIYRHIKLSDFSYKIIPMSTRNVTFTRVCITVLFTTILTPSRFTYLMRRHPPKSRSCFRRFSE